MLLLYFMERGLLSTYWTLGTVLWLGCSCQLCDVSRGKEEDRRTPVQKYTGK